MALTLLRAHARLTTPRLLPPPQRLKVRLDTTGATAYEPIPGPVAGNAPLATVVGTGNVIDISTSTETKVGQFQLSRLVTTIDARNVSSTIVNIILVRSGVAAAGHGSTSSHCSLATNVHDRPR